MMTADERQSVDRAKVAVAKTFNGALAMLAALGIFLAIAFLIGIAAQGATGILVVIAVVVIAKHEDKAKQAKLMAKHRARMEAATASQPKAPMTQGYDSIIAQDNAQRVTQPDRID